MKNSGLPHLSLQESLVFHDIWWLDNTMNVLQFQINTRTTLSCPLMRTAPKSEHFALLFRKHLFFFSEDHWTHSWNMFCFFSATWRKTWKASFLADFMSLSLILECQASCPHPTTILLWQAAQRLTNFSQCKNILWAWGNDHWTSLGVGSLPASEGDRGSIPGLGRSHMPGGT